MIDEDNPYAMAQSIKSVVLIAAGHFGDDNSLTNEIAGKYFRMAQEYTGYNRKPYYCASLGLHFWLDLPITLDKSASWKATLSGGAGHYIKHWDYASSHTSIEAGMHQPYISPRWKDPHQFKCRRPNCACGGTPPTVSCHVPSRLIWVSSTLLVSKLYCYYLLLLVASNSSY